MVQEQRIQAAEQRRDWFVHNRFGLFIHWGLYALPARHEWVKNREMLTDEHYQRYFKHFDPDLYDPKEWARTAKRAGMRYAVLTTKHHEGFCLWDSQLTDYKAPNTPAGRDLLRPWVEAFRAEGLKIGFYHSLIDWHHPEFPVDGLHPQREDLAFREQAQGRDVSKYAEYLRGQVRELLTNYGTIDILWFDFSYSRMDWGWSKGKGKDDWQSEQLVQMVHELQPNILINNRTEVGGDFQTPEQVQPRGWIQVDGKPVTWEACQTLNGSWGYDRDNLDWKSPDLLVRMLVDSVAKGGNLLLNVGPTARGEFDARAVATLDAIGEWMRLHNRSIYGATQSDFTPPPDCRLTQRGNRLYLHVFAWPMIDIYLDGLADRVEYAQLLNDASEIRMDVDKSDANTLTLKLPIQRPDVLVPVIELFLKED
ncbi:alpha-L-fucosidase [Reticulibacter mediterranei]|uniref:alpha-L-fucosidase n=1 Tax=Reticulibacter mediterranei TaxID=2778369 RepID=A0A8J3MYI0_9CHLR|nr:alpha-L-fucosidase [Reticulibacter mediterranei]GHO90907.1 alpha-L-fucosidase [Reticulibacter mediterranei]